MMAAEVAMEPDGVEKLSSNVMNYLVWRYLQESGYGKTAKQLQYQWMGREVSPESLPFAPKIKKSCLIHMAQDGLLLDHLQAEVKKINRQYAFGSDHGRKFSVPADEPREKKTRIRSASRVPSTIDREMHNGSPAEPPARRAKGKRKSGGAEKRVNGDAMDVDAATTNAAGATEPPAADAESPLPVIDEMPPISTLEIGESKGTITEKPRDLTESTSFVGLEPGVLLEHVTWSPHNRTALVTAGKNHMRVFKVGTNDVPENNVYTRATTVAIPSEEYEVQAFCWTEKGSGAFTTLEKIKNEDGDEMMQYKMFGFTDYGQKVNLVDPNAGWVLSLKYHAESELLLSLSWGEQSHIKIWSYSETIYENSKRRVEPKYELKWAKTMPSMLYAAEWTAPNRFMVCGQNKLDLYEVGDDIQLIKSLSTEHEWFHLEFDPVYETAAITDQEMQTLGIGRIVGDDLQITTKTFDFKITDLAFQPLHSKPDPPSDPAAAPPQRILAAASDMGQVYLFDVIAQDGVLQIQKLEMGHDAIAQRLAFSHDGFLLAAAGYDTLNVWKTLEGSAQPKCIWHIPHGTDERWKSEERSHSGGVANGTEGGEEDGAQDDHFVHKLGWDSDGKRIAFGMNGQVAVIRL